MLVLVILLGLVLRVVFFFDKSTDELVSMWYVLRNSKSSWLEFNVNDSLLKGYIGYPPLQHYIIGRFKSKYWPYVGKFLNIVYDLIVGVLVYFMMRFLLKELGAEASMSGLSSLLAVFLFLTSPILLPITARMRAISARSFGMLLTTLYFLVFGFIQIQSIWYLLPVALGIGYVIILSSQFALQVYIFFNLLLAVFMVSVVPIIILISSMLVAWIIPNSGARKILKHSWNHKVWYVRNRTEGSPAQLRNDIREILKLPLSFLRYPKKALHFCVHNFTVSIALYSAPIIFITGALFIFNPGLMDPLRLNPWLDYFMMLSLASFITFVFTSIPVFGFLGQAERYFEYSAPFYSMLFIMMVVTTNGNLNMLLFTLMLVHILGIMFNFIWLHKSDFNKKDEEMNTNFEEIVEWFRSSEEEVNILTCPLKYTYQFSVILKKKDIGEHVKLYYRFISRPDEKGFKYFEEDIGGFVKSGNEWKKSIDVLTQNPEVLKTKYGITHLVLNKKFEEAIRYTWKYKFNELLNNPVFENEKYKICSLS